MAFKYKLKEEPFKVGDIKTTGGVKTTVRNVDPETGAVAWKVEYVPAFDSTFKEFQELRQFLKKLAQKTDDNVIDTLSDDVNKLFNQFRTHLRKKYPDEYKKVAPTNEGINDHLDLVHVYGKDGKMYGTGSVEKVEGDKTFVRFDGSTVKRFPSDRVKPVKEEEVEEMSTSAGAGSYLTKYAFKKKKVEENIGATLGPGPKAGPDGVKNNYYVTKFKYKLVPKDKNGNYVQKGSGLEVKNF
jgi:hypothetical protein